MLFVPHGKCTDLNPDVWGIWLQKKDLKKVPFWLVDPTQCPVGILRSRTGFVHPGMICLDIFDGKPATRQWFSGFCLWDENHKKGSPKPARKKIPQSDICLVFAGSTENSHFVAYTGPGYLFMTNCSSTSQFWVGQKADSKPD